MEIAFSENLVNEIDEKIILTMLVGIFESLGNNGLTIEESEKLLFSPYMIDVLQNRNCSKSVIEILERGCELENIESLLPDNLIEEIDKLKKASLNLLKKYGQQREERWIKTMD